MYFLPGLTTLPDRRALGEALIALALFAVAVGVLAPPGLLTEDRPVVGGEALWVVALALVIPATLEELVFRGLLVPRFTWPWATFSTLAYVIWHPLAAWFFLPRAWPLFSSPAFLILVTLLGLLCYGLYSRSRSLWTAVLLHWWVVASWKLLGGGRWVA